LLLQGGPRSVADRRRLPYRPVRGLRAGAGTVAL